MNETEKEVTKAIQSAASGRTMITIAHRISTIENADRIYKVENGVVCECDINHLGEKLADNLADN